jgi:hypothetical protein
MSLASNVWRAMLNARWASPCSTEEIKLPVDDAQAMELVLNVVHLRFGAVQEVSALYYEQAMALALLYDKYEVVHLMKPFSGNLLQSGGQIVPAANQWELLGWISIAWKFGLKYQLILRFKDAIEGLDMHHICRVEQDMPSAHSDLLPEVFYSELNAPKSYPYFIQLLAFWVCASGFAEHRTFVHSQRPSTV